MEGRMVWNGNRALRKVENKKQQYRKIYLQSSSAGRWLRAQDSRTLKDVVFLV